MSLAGAAGPWRWLAGLLYVPLLYGAGWLLALPLPLAPADRPLIGTAFTLALFLLSLPLWVGRMWRQPAPWTTLGVLGPAPAVLRALLRGLLKALLLLLVLSLPLVLGGWAHWQGGVALSDWINALLLMLGVGFAEELVFRGWLWGELTQLLGGSRLAGQRALLAQAVLFSLVHTRFNLGPAALLALLGGLGLLGLVLGLQRRADGGLLWGAIGLHGGLVGGWFLLQGSLLQLSSQAPAWLVGPGEVAPNPIGGLVGWLGLGALLWVRRRWWAHQARP
ncbi:CPBP family intramembrane metalloprotease [Synechococcus sp. CBW1002]|uniref:CPBP family intramembrane glutamic endopeptidase n=1 Tax=Synechococcus sp. CBW1002 TaxID=1353134 RepID=UPI0018CFB516|nr:CPBP family intramembrane glutamic endopeptidase [Synechococcus sp. CBW1002]QPN61185.1 CPBP family intramembrane metalloprotease [Synechococcus sp. CBW1002]